MGMAANDAQKKWKLGRKGEKGRRKEVGNSATLRAAKIVRENEPSERMTTV